MNITEHYYDFKSMSLMMKYFLREPMPYTYCILLLELINNPKYLQSAAYKCKKSIMTKSVS